MAQLIPDGNYIIYSDAFYGRVTLAAEGGKFTVVKETSTPTNVPLSQRILVTAVPELGNNRYTFTVPGISGKNKAANATPVTAGTTPLEGGATPGAYIVTKGVKPNHQFQIQLDLENEWTCKGAGNDKDLVLDAISGEASHLWSFVALPNL